MHSEDPRATQPDENDGMNLDGHVADHPPGAHMPEGQDQNAPAGEHGTSSTPAAMRHEATGHEGMGHAPAEPGADQDEAMDRAMHGREVAHEGAHAVAPGGHPAEHEDHAGQVDHTGHEQMFRQRFWVCLLLSIPVLLYSPMLQMWFGFSLPAFPGSQWIGPLFSVDRLPLWRRALPADGRARAARTASPA